VIVYWVLPPYLPALQDRCEASGFDAEHRAFVRGLQHRFANLIVVDARRSVREPEAFWDTHHLSAEGAYPFSLALGDLIRKTLPTASPGPARPDAGRWLTLARFRPRPLPDDVEELGATVTALRQSSAATTR
jgi:hypothetical protein